MKIKNIFIFCALALPALLFSSCQNEEDEVFGQSSSQRLEQDLANVKNVLRSAENGWAVDYYFGDDQQYGGMVMTIKFDSLTCTAASELIPEEVTSYYSMTTDQGPVLTFDTYNRVIHSLANPSAANYEGYHADFEYVVMSATPELVVLKGKRIGNYAYMRPLKEPMLDYVGRTTAMSDSIHAATAVGKVGNDSVIATFNYSGRSITFTYSADSTFNESRYFTYTDKGVRLYSAVEVAGMALSDFTYQEDGMLLTATNQGANSFTMNGRTPDTYVNYAAFAGTYWLHFQRYTRDDGYVADSAQVTLTPLVEGESYTMSGLNSNYDLVINYDRGNGRLEWNTQRVITYDNGNEIWSNAASQAQGGNLSLGNTNCGMVTVWNENSEHPVYTWVTNGYAALPTDSWCLWESGPGASSSIGQILEGELLYFGRLSVLYYVSSMVKID